MMWTRLIGWGLIALSAVAAFQIVGNGVHALSERRRVAELVPFLLGLAFWMGIAVLGRALIQTGSYSPGIALQNTLDWLRPFWSAHRTGILIAGGASLLGFFLMGLPAAALTEGCTWIWNHTVGPKLSWPEPHGDNTWPFLLLSSFFGPWVIFGIHLLTGRVLLTLSLSAGAQCLVYFLFRLAHR
jgi:hypothetical protein